MQCMLRACCVLRCGAHGTCEMRRTYPFYLFHAMHMGTHPVVLVLYGHALEVLCPRHGLRLCHHAFNNNLLIACVCCAYKYKKILLSLGFVPHASTKKDHARWGSLLLIYTTFRLHARCVMSNPISNHDCEFAL